MKLKLLLIITASLATTKAEQSEALKDFSAGYNQFIADIYKELLKSNTGNLLVCPLSVQVTLGLASYGAQEETAKQLAAGLHLPEDKQKLKTVFKELSPYFKDNGKYTLTSANKIYLKDGFEILKDFKSTAIDVFKSDIESLDFSKSETAAAQINKWVEKQTHDKIKNVISEADLNADTRAILINAMYFHGQWVSKFKEENTKKRKFTTLNKNEIQVDTMEITENFKYWENPNLNAKFLELPYEGGEVTMTLILPNAQDGLSGLEAHVAEIFETPQYTKEKVHVMVPKFKIESSIQFKPILQALGIVDAFGDSANFSGLSPVPVKIDKVVQKAFIEVEEKGTTAAAATAAVFATRSRRPKANPPKEFIADHPFIFVLKSQAGVLFIGRYVQA